MTGQQKPDKLVTQFRSITIGTQATLTCLAEDAFLANDQNLYRELRELNEIFTRMSEAILQKRGAGTPKKPKIKLTVVK